MALTVSFKPATAGRTYTVEVLATGDDGAVEEIPRPGALRIEPAPPQEGSE